MKIIGRREINSAKLAVASTLENLIVESAAAARPPERLTVSEAAVKYRTLNNPGSYVGPWDNSITPYLVEPMDELQSLDFSGWCFVGPAQCGKTDQVLNWLIYSAVCDPADMMIVQTSGPTARDFSMRRIDRLHRHSQAIKDKLVTGKQSDNVFDKHYRNGMILTLSWPSINELSGKPIPRLWLTDYDRMPQDVDGEGAPFELARKRATTFRRYGMCAAESSPGFIVENAKWRRKSPHEAPPTKGILSIYNKGDRRRWYWPCVKCSEWFEPSFNLISYPDSADFMESAEAAVMVCPHCAFQFGHDPIGDVPGKFEMNTRGRWVKDNMRLLKSGQLVGTPPRTSIASFWLKGAAAAFSDWKTLVFNYLTAEAEYEANGNEDSLKTTINTDQGEPYTPKAQESDRLPEVLKDRARDYGIQIVNPAVRFLIATIDVQKHRFVVQVHGICLNGDVFIVDRFDIKKSKRVDEDGEHLWVNPAAYQEDWKLIGEEVILKSYELADGSGRRMSVKLVMCDSGGREGVTTNAYKFVRWLRWGDKGLPVEQIEQEGGDTLAQAQQGTYEWVPGMAGRFMLVKGSALKNAPRVKIDYPDSQRKDRHAGARGEIPVAFINVNSIKDTVNNMLDRTDPGGRIYFPNWLDDSFYAELTVEVKSPSKGWINPKNFRNESWDLLAYCVAATLLPTINLERMDPEEPPSWAAEWDHNDLVFSIEEKTKPFEPKKTDLDNLADLAGKLA